MNNPLKSILVEGSAEQIELNHRICTDYFCLQLGIWEIAINSVLLNHTVDRDYIFTISTNLVQGHQYILGKLKLVNTNLYQFKVSKDVQYEVINTTPLWFIINNASSEHFTLFLNEWPKPVNKKRPKNIVLGINTLFRRII